MSGDRGLPVCVVLGVALRLDSGLSVEKYLPNTIRLCMVILVVIR